MDSTTIMLLIAGFLYGIFLLFINVMAYRIHRNGKILDASFDTVKGKVLDKREIRTKNVFSWYVYCEFKVPGSSQSFFADSQVQKEVFATAQKGSLLEIRYNPNDPTVSEVGGAIRKKQLITLTLLIDALSLLMVILIVVRKFMN